MSIFSLATKTIFDNVSAQVITQVSFDVRQDVGEGHIQITVSGLSNFENIYIWVSQDEGVTYISYLMGGIQITLNNKNNVLKLEKDLYYGFTKDATSSPVTCICEYMLRNS